MSQDATTAGLCDPCRQIFADKRPLQDGRTFHYHKNELLYDDVEVFLSAVKQGCQFCYHLKALWPQKVWTQASKIKAKSTRFEVKLDHIFTHQNPLWIELCFISTLGTKKEIKIMAVLSTSLFQSFGLGNEIGQLQHFEKGCTALGPWTGSQVSLNQARYWFDSCCHSHRTCHQAFPETNRFMPTRLVYIGDSQRKSCPRLQNTASLSQPEQYATLSHCWGRRPMIRLLRHNIATFYESIPLSKLSKVFLQAIEVTRLLGLEYLWIDSICIMQDDIEDWKMEAAAMGEVYRNCYCNIAATGSKDGQKGMFAERDPRLIFPITLQLNNYDGKLYAIDEFFWRQELYCGPLARRGWVFQERLLSPRTIHFGQDQLFWECHELEACETFPFGIRSARITGSGPMNAVYRPYKMSIRPDVIFKSDGSDRGEYLRLWHQLLEEYTRTRMTKDSDRLPGIAGIARHFKRFLRCRYLAGLWENDILHELLWSQSGGDHIGSTKLEGPSWTWASMTTGVFWFDYERDTYLADALETELEDGGDEMLGVKSGTIVLQGTLHQSRPLQDPPSPSLNHRHQDVSEVEIYSSCHSNKAASRTAFVSTLWQYLDVDDGCQAEYLLPLATSMSDKSSHKNIEGLLLVRAAGSEVEPAKYRRIGYFRAEDCDSADFAKLQEAIRVAERTVLHLV